ncbi:hypothetical protein ACFLQL_03070 [Verrucomicrobiota bacterium]
MKKRNGFVSNSSTTSFCIYGTTTDDFDIPARHEDADLWEENVLEELQKLDDRFTCDHYPEVAVYIGIPWSDIKDDETGKMFKEKIAAVLNKVIGIDVKCGTHIEAWRDG